MGGCLQDAGEGASPCPQSTRFLHVLVSDDHTVAIDAIATWTDDETTRRAVWDLLAQTPPPMGYDPTILGFADWDDPVFTPLRVEPTCIQMLRGEQMRQGDYTYRIWTPVS